MIFFYRSYSPNAAAQAVADAAVGGWPTHHLVSGPDWIDATRAGQHAGLAWPPHSHDQARYVSPGGSMKWEVTSNAGVPGLVGNGGYKKSKSKSESHGGPGSGKCFTVTF